ncbi:MAG TPA: hypothetical protein VEG37_10675 [Burkholderiales bacterium]|nr:hypothetical protein [Burkholderiales bacterium]
MPKADDLQDKIDALMRKPEALGREEIVPTLTDVVAMGAERAALPELSPEQLEAIAIEIYQHVLQNLDARITNELQRHLKPQLSRMLEQVLERILAELKNSTKSLVDDAIAHALDAQLEHHQRLSRSAPPAGKRSNSDK